MPEPRAETPRRREPATVVNGTRVTVAFPFSQIRLQEPSQELRLLADLVADLADRLVTVSNDRPAKAIQARAHQLAQALEGTGQASSSGPPMARRASA